MARSAETMGQRHLDSEQERRRLDSLVETGLAALRQKRPLSEVLSARDLEALRSRYSHFEDCRDEAGFLAASAHVVTRVATPRPYLHLISSNHAREYGCFGSFWDQTGGGFCCLDSVLAGAVTSHKDVSYVPTVPRATDQRRFFLREEDPSGGPARSWHLFPQAGREEERYDHFECRQGLGTVELSATREGIAGDLLVFVPVDDPLEVWRLRLANRSDRPRRIGLFLAVNWGLESYPGYYFDPRVVSAGRVHPELHALVALNQDQNNKHPRTGFLMSAREFQGFDLSGEDFNGPGHARLFPRAVEEGRCRGSLGLQPCLGLIGALQFELELEPGQEETLELLLGVTAPDPEKSTVHLSGLRHRYLEPGGVERARVELERSWAMMLGQHRALTPDAEVDRFFNVWSKYQAKNTARWTRALDKVGYRDLLQDLMGVNSFDSGYTATMLPVALRYQFPDGRAVRQFAKFHGTAHDERMYMDSSAGSPTPWWITFKKPVISPCWTERRILQTRAPEGGGRRGQPRSTSTPCGA